MGFRFSSLKRTFSAFADTSRLAAASPFWRIKRWVGDIRNASGPQKVTYRRIPAPPLLWSIRRPCSLSSSIGPSKCSQVHRLLRWKFVASLGGRTRRNMLWLEGLPMTFSLGRSCAFRSKEPTSAGARCVIPCRFYPFDCPSQVACSNVGERLKIPLTCQIRASMGYPSMSYQARCDFIYTSTRHRNHHPPNKEVLSSPSSHTSPCDTDNGIWRPSYYSQSAWAHASLASHSLDPLIINRCYRIASCALEDGRTIHGISRPQRGGNVTKA